MAVWLRHFLPGKALVGAAAKTLSGYGDAIDRYIVPELGHARLCDLTRGHLKQFVLRLAARGLDPMTVGRVYGLTPAALAEAVASLQRLVDLLEILVRNASFACEMLDEQIAQAAAGLWAAP